MVCHSSRATDLRGRVDGIHNYSPVPFPVAQIQVSILATQQTPWGPTYVPLMTVVTGSDGMYYFRNAPAGDFVLQVGAAFYPLRIYPQQAQDIQAVLVRF